MLERKGEKGKKKNPNHEPQILRRNSCPNVARPRKAVVVCLTSSAAIANFGLCARTSLPVYSSFLSSLGICCCEEVPVTDFWIGIWWSPLELSTSFCESSRGFFNQVWSAVYRLLNPPDPCLFVCFLRLTAVVLLVLFCSVLVPLLLFLLLVNCVRMKFLLFVLFAGWRFFFFFFSTLLVLNSFLGLRFVSIWMVLDAAWFVLRVF